MEIETLRDINRRSYEEHVMFSDRKYLLNYRGMTAAGEVSMKT